MNAVDSQLKILIADNVQPKDLKNDTATIAASVYDGLEGAGILKPFSRTECLLISRAILTALEKQADIMIEEFEMMDREEEESIQRMTIESQ